MGFGERGISDQPFGPLQRFLFAGGVGGHVPVGGFDVLRHHMGSGEFFNELADAAPADGPVKALIDGLADSDGGFRFMALPYTYCTRVGL